MAQHRNRYDEQLIEMRKEAETHQMEILRIQQENELRRREKYDEAYGGQESFRSNRSHAPAFGG